MRPIYLTIFATVALVAVAFAVTAGTAGAFPADSQKTGQPCTTCHTTATGGPLTATGTAYQAAGRVWPIPSAPAAAPAAAPAPAPALAPAPAPVPAAAPAAGAAPATAPSTLPTTGDVGAASQLPLALMYLSGAFAGLGLSLRRRR